MQCVFLLFLFRACFPVHNYLKVCTKLKNLKSLILYYSNCPKDDEENLKEIKKFVNNGNFPPSTLSLKHLTWISFVHKQIIEMKRNFSIAIPKIILGNLTT